MINPSFFLESCIRKTLTRLCLPHSYIFFNQIKHHCVCMVWLICTLLLFFNLTNMNNNKKIIITKYQNWSLMLRKCEFIDRYPTCVYPVFSDISFNIIDSNIHLVKSVPQFKVVNIVLWRQNKTKHPISILKSKRCQN